MAPLYLDSRSTCACGGRRCSRLDVYIYKSFTMALGGGGCAGTTACRLETAGPQHRHAFLSAVRIMNVRERGSLHGNGGAQSGFY